MTLVRSASGIYEGDYRFKDIPRLHISMGTRKKPEARDRYDAVRVLFKQRRVEMIDQLRAGVLTVDRVEAMVRHAEPLVPIAGDVVEAEATSRSWGTVNDIATRYLDWLELHPKKSAGTHRAARSMVRRFVAFEVELDGVTRPIGEIPFEAVTSTMMQAYQAALIRDGAAANTVMNYVVRAGALWNWLEAQEARAARDERRVPRLIFSPLDNEMIAARKTARERSLTITEADRLFAATPGPLMAFAGLGLLAGLRFGEAQHLSPRDVDLDVGIISIRDKVLPDGREWRPKTKRSRRSVPIVDELRPLLERQLVKYASDAWLFPRLADPTWPVSAQNTRDHFTAVIVRAGLPTGRRNPQGVVFHTLRHTFASWLAMRGVDLYTIAQLLGERLETVEDTYAHLSPDFKRAAIAKLAGAVRMPTPATDGAENFSGATQKLPQKEEV